MTSSELNELKKRIEDIRNELKELSDEELEMVLGGVTLYGGKAATPMFVSIKSDPKGILYNKNASIAVNPQNAFSFFVEDDSLSYGNITCFKN